MEVLESEENNKNKDSQRKNVEFHLKQNLSEIIEQEMEHSDLSRNKPSEQPPLESIESSLRDEEF